MHVPLRHRCGRTATTKHGADPFFKTMLSKTFKAIRNKHIVFSFINFQFDPEDLEITLWKFGSTQKITTFIFTDHDCLAQRIVYNMLKELKMISQNCVRVLFIKDVDWQDKHDAIKNYHIRISKNKFKRLFRKDTEELQWKHDYSNALQLTKGKENNLVKQIIAKENYKQQLLILSEGRRLYKKVWFGSAENLILEQRLDLNKKGEGKRRFGYRLPPERWDHQKQKRLIKRFSKPTKGRSNKIPKSNYVSRTNDENFHEKKLYITFDSSKELYKNLPASIYSNRERV